MSNELDLKCEYCDRPQRFCVGSRACIGRKAAAQKIEAQNIQDSGEPLCPHCHRLEYLCVGPKACKAKIQAGKARDLARVQERIANGTFAPPPPEKIVNQFQTGETLPEDQAGRELASNGKLAEMPASGVRTAEDELARTRHSNIFVQSHVCPVHGVAHPDGFICERTNG